MTAAGGADIILVIASLGAVFVGLLLLMGAMLAYLTRNVEDIPPESDAKNDVWYNDI